MRTDVGKDRPPEDEGRELEADHDEHNGSDDTSNNRHHCGPAPPLLPRPRKQFGQDVAAVQREHREQVHQAPTHVDPEHDNHEEAHVVGSETAKQSGDSCNDPAEHKPATGPARATLMRCQRVASARGCQCVKPPKL